jgi:hypothetical protein
MVSISFAAVSNEVEKRISAEDEMSVKRIVALALVVLSSVTACSKEERVSTEAVSMDSQASKGIAVEAADANRMTPATPSSVATPQRMIIRTASLRLVSTDTAKTFTDLEQIASQTGGYVETSRSWRNEDQLYASITLRVPEARLHESLAAVRKSGKRVENEQLGGNDVSQEFTDLTAHLRNYEATEKELRELLSTIRQRSQKASEVLEIHRELMNIRGEIERVKGRVNYLQTMTSLATINIEILPDAVAQSVVKSGWEPVGIMKDAMRATVATIQAMANVAIWFFIFVLPIMLLVGGTLYAAARLIRASRKDTVPAA